MFALRACGQQVSVKSLRRFGASEKLPVISLVQMGESGTLSHITDSQAADLPSIQQLLFNS